MEFSCTRLGCVSNISCVSLHAECISCLIKLAKTFFKIDLKSELFPISL